MSSKSVMKVAILAATVKGQDTADKICQVLPGSEVIPVDRGVRASLEALWQTHDGIICIMAAGIVVRCLDGLCRSKYTDPCVVVVDENGSFAISLLSGHIGGGNWLVDSLSELFGTTAVITTASDISGHTSVDLWSIENNLIIVNPSLLASVSAKLLNSGTLTLYQEHDFLGRIPDDFKITGKPSEADILISHNAVSSGNSLHLLPKNRYVGCGCRRGVSVVELQEAFEELEKETAIDLRSIAALASIDLKKDEKGLRKLAALHRWPMRFFPKELLDKVETPSKSQLVYEKVGTASVSEAAALLAAASGGRPGRLIITKRKWKRITIAVAETVS